MQSDIRLFRDLLGVGSVVLLSGVGASSAGTLRHNIDAALNTLTEAELTIVDATIDGILRAREDERNT